MDRWMPSPEESADFSTLPPDQRRAMVSYIKTEGDPDPIVTIAKDPASGNVHLEVITAAPWQTKDFGGNNDPAAVVVGGESYASAFRGQRIEATIEPSGASHAWTFDSNAATGHAEASVKAGVFANSEGETETGASVALGGGSTLLESGVRYS